MTQPVSARIVLGLSIGLILISGAVAAHEPWLLTPQEVQTLSLQSVPELFRSPSLLLVFALFATLTVFAAVLAGQLLRPTEDRLFRRLSHHSRDWGPLCLRLGLGTTVGMNALGGLPRHGTETWSTPTLFVPDMQLTLISGWEWLALPALITSVLLVLGLGTRLAALVTLGLVGFGSCLFSVDFIAYYGFHFAAPAFLLLHVGSGALSLDRLLPPSLPPLLPNAPTLVWSLVQVTMGGTFAAIAVLMKFLQPTLLIAILEHGNMWFFGLPLSVVALIMMAVELMAGILLALGQLIRPISLFLLGAFSFFAISLQETPLLHGNLYGIFLFFLLHGGAPIDLFQRRQVTLAEARGI
ncbi:hypothetical protein [Phaeobacter gallaeciensis]|uniref:hypothetical protein n=1 Tax=Phaeobacter gallaeciensis TaxID=60890 RepID=UPI000BBCA428|nr:hypothetical protein [Phaeobacter gallaeciensis]ATF20258.1 hypothetical protein PhaeoP129_03668 [Phaeobacter gallaeciensis]ATF24367.1 hypothetical protein PhaeoP128_03669 [Phaeobacter gallaeciensis]